MNYLVKIINRNIGAETNSVNAKELHSYIQAKSRFNDWITNRITKYGFKENQDFIIVTTKTTGRPSKEYYITLDMAKELSMVENNDKGREARRWFIEIAKQYTATPTQLDLITPYEVRRDLATARRKLTIEKKKHRGTAQLYEQAHKESERLKLELVRVNDTLHKTMQKDFLKADIALILYQLTNRFQTLPSIAKNGKNLNTDTKAGLEYWDDKYKPLIDEARDFENRIKNKMTQQLKLIVSTVERDILNRFNESMEVNTRSIKLPYIG